ncbi:unnamed protein product [Prunus armeniaca]
MEGSRARYLQGFVPKSPKDWNSGYWSDGCVRKIPLACSSGDGFLNYTGVKLPDTSSSWYDKSMSLKECNGLCTAYANLDIREGGTGCLLWFGNLTDVAQFTSGGGQDLYVRMAASELGVRTSMVKSIELYLELGPQMVVISSVGLAASSAVKQNHIEEKSEFNKKKLPGILISSAVFLVVTLLIGLILHIRNKKLRNQGVRSIDCTKDYLGEDRDDMELPPLFDLSTVAKATNDFSSSNKLGEGGFGPVYKGTLIGGKEIAVKRLSKNSGQGMIEFKNEVKLIARLQHRNLVKLLGCCVQEEEKILIYEFMPNKSFDFFIFSMVLSDANHMAFNLKFSSDQEGQRLLDWPTCFHIIGGIARGLLYLHQDSRLRIIHRDLKASNILLDNSMNPKISDFGLAKTFGSDQSRGNTNRVVGTFGYISPEYAVDGIFSMKSDVFSVGVILLEMLSRKKNRGFSHPDHHLNLLGYAWILWIEDKALELIDKTLRDSCTISEVLRCLHVALLCVQRVPEDRPSMSSVVLMLSSDVTLPPPMQPGFYTERSVPESPLSTRRCSANTSITIIEAR